VSLYKDGSSRMGTHVRPRAETDQGTGKSAHPTERFFPGSKGDFSYELGTPNKFGISSDEEQARQGPLKSSKLSLSHPKHSLVSPSIILGIAKRPNPRRGWRFQALSPREGDRPNV
jgi:hypothetical protein